MSGIFVTEESDNVTLVFLSQARTCSQCDTWAHYGLSVDSEPFEPRCKKHLPDGIVQEYWTRRMLLAAQDGDEKKARACLRNITAEARRNGYERCALIADVKAQDARNSTYSNKDMARGAEDMAKRIAHSIRLI
jgi:hypothetical protein